MKKLFFAAVVARSGLAPLAAAPSQVPVPSDSRRACPRSKWYR